MGRIRFRRARFQTPSSDLISEFLVLTELRRKNSVSSSLSAKANLTELFFRNVPVTPTPSIFPKVLPYKWGVYCRTNGRRTAVQMGGVLQGFPFFKAAEARKVRRYKWGAYCRTNWRCTAVLFRQVVGVGVSETLPISCRTHRVCRRTQ